MEWTRELTLEFIHLYKKEPCIWNPKDPNRKNRKYVYEAWDRIASSMSVQPCSVEELKRKKDSIMAILRKVCAKERNMTDENLDFKPHWFAFKALSFLKDVYRPKPLYETESTFDPDAFEISNSSPAHEDYAGSSENFEKASEFALPQPITPVYNRPQANSTISQKNNSRKRKRQSDFEEMYSDELYHYDDNSQSARQTGHDPNQKDICSLYGDLLAAKLRNFSEETRDYLMHEIDNLVYRTKMEQRDVQLSKNSRMKRNSASLVRRANQQPPAEEIVYDHEPEPQTSAVESNFEDDISLTNEFPSQVIVKEEREYV